MYSPTMQPWQPAQLTFSPLTTDAHANVRLLIHSSHSPAPSAGEYLSLGQSSQPVRIVSPACLLNFPEEQSLHSAWPACCWYFPEEQRLQSIPRSGYHPTGHKWHSVFRGFFWYCPVSHMTQLSKFWKYPRGHSSHSCVLHSCGVPPQANPAEQLWQVALSFWLSVWYWPNEHTLHSVSLVMNSRPAWQNWHNGVFDLEICVVSSTRYCPSPQSLHKAVRDAENLPETHVLQTASASWFSVWYLPPPHSAHSCVMSVNWIWFLPRPAGQKL